MLYERISGKITNLTENFDGWVGSFGWAGRHEIVFSAEAHGESPIYNIFPEICHERCHPIKLTDGFNDDIAAGEKIVVDTPTSISETVLFNRMSLRAPTAIFILEPASCVIGGEKLKAMLLGVSKEELPDAH